MDEFSLDSPLVSEGGKEWRQMDGKILEIRDEAENSTLVYDVKTFELKA